MRACGRVLCVLLVAWSAAAHAVPSPPLSRVLRGEALGSYEAAREAFKAGRYQQALAGFVRAHALSGEARLLWNSAACLRKLERNAEALRNLDAYLAQGAAKLTALELEEVKRAHAAVKQLVATVRITTVPPGAAVSIDGNEVTAAPAQGVYLEPGRHAFVFRLEGHQDVVRQEAVGAGETVDWTINLVPVKPATEEQKTAAPAEATAQLRGAPSRQRSLKPLLVSGGGVVAAGVGGGLMVLAAGDHARLRAECRTMCSPEVVAASRTKETAGLVLVAAGAAAIAGGLGFWLLQSTDGDAAIALTPSGAALEVRF